MKTEETIKDLCKFCGRSDHGVVPCMWYVEHQAHNKKFIHKDHCMFCRAQDQLEIPPSKPEKKVVCKDQQGNEYERHQWILCDSQIIPESGHLAKEYLIACGDCGIKKVATKLTINVS